MCAHAGTVDEIQKMHIRTVPMGETVARLAYQKETHTLAVCCSRTELRTAPPRAGKFHPVSTTDLILRRFHDRGRNVGAIARVSFDTRAE
jgi:hypothetical protein